MQCPLILLVKVAWKQYSDLGSEEGNMMRNGIFDYGSEELN
jgi:hypothetical protein